MATIREKIKEIRKRQRANFGGAFKKVLGKQALRSQALHRLISFNPGTQRFPSRRLLGF